MSTAVELVDVCCTFGHHRVIQNLSLRVETGETVAIVGESGCGKSVT
ncbi:MAG: ATP-binding cassette domain-containing protein, partial [Planctomycetaceae bacterium]|nr:ATP-binding cassette domain-containing protein [Planctomycetaceae bacterium]